uniref:Acetyl-coenzyme A carboxylase carboxyl transferase subunit beta n=1 Tax=Monotropa uniflora TaxID=50148 RepID=A0A221SR01_MONUN|nr:acetyl-CoA carboxylase carboxyltransferase beta subunit [Monotropa uniflora]ASN78961.1 acetyl-CoA carboxylase carboxyltransferase beta subunit [Monotropa uniflora]
MYIIKYFNKLKMQHMDINKLMETIGLFNCLFISNYNTVKLIKTNFRTNFKNSDNAERWERPDRTSKRKKLDLENVALTMRKKSIESIHSYAKKNTKIKEELEQHLLYVDKKKNKLNERKQQRALETLKDESEERELNKFQANIQQLHRQIINNIAQENEEIKNMDQENEEIKNMDQENEEIKNMERGIEDERDRFEQNPIDTEEEINPENEEEKDMYQEERVKREKDDEFENMYQEDNEFENMYQEDNKLGNMYQEDDEFENIYQEDNEFENMYQEDNELRNMYQKDDEFENMYHEDNEFENMYQEDNKLGNMYQEDDEFENIYQEDNKFKNMYQDNDKLGNLDQTNEEVNNLDQINEEVNNLDQINEEVNNLDQINEEVNNLDHKTIDILNIIDKKYFQEDDNIERKVTIESLIKLQRDYLYNLDKIEDSITPEFIERCKKEYLTVEEIDKINKLGSIEDIKEYYRNNINKYYTNKFNKDRFHKIEHENNETINPETIDILHIFHHKYFKEDTNIECKITLEFIIQLEQAYFTDLEEIDKITLEFVERRIEKKYLTADEIARVRKLGSIDNIKEYYFENIGKYYRKQINQAFFSKIKQDDFTNINQETIDIINLIDRDYYIEYEEKVEHTITNESIQNLKQEYLNKINNIGKKITRKYIDKLKKEYTTLEEKEKISKLGSIANIKKYYRENLDKFYFNKIYQYESIIMDQYFQDNIDKDVRYIIENIEQEYIEKEKIKRKTIKQKIPLESIILFQLEYFDKMDEIDKITFSSIKRLYTKKYLTSENIEKLIALKYLGNIKKYYFRTVDKYYDKYYIKTINQYYSRKIKQDNVSHKITLEYIDQLKKEYSNKVDEIDNIRLKSIEKIDKKAFPTVEDEEKLRKLIAIDYYSKKARKKTENEIFKNIDQYYFNQIDQYYSNKVEKNNIDKKNVYLKEERDEFKQDPIDTEEEINQEDEEINKGNGKESYIINPKRRTNYSHLWVQCETCYGVNYKALFDLKLYICEWCQAHVQMNSLVRINFLIDPGTWVPMDEDMISDPIAFDSVEEVKPFDLVKWESDMDKLIENEKIPELNLLAEQFNESEQMDIESMHKIEQEYIQTIQHIKKIEKEFSDKIYKNMIYTENKKENMDQRDIKNERDRFGQDPIDTEDFIDTEEDETEEEIEQTYEERILSDQHETGFPEAIQTGIAKFNGIPIALGVMDFKFRGGSMGSVVGEKITRLIEYATKEFLPLIIVCASGGARMQEGSLSLLQMSKISCALYTYKLNKRLFYVSILASPTTGGVTASFGMLGHIIISEPGATIAFAGRRIIEELLKIEVDEDTQEADLLFEKGAFDLLIPRQYFKKILSLLYLFHNYSN